MYTDRFIRGRGYDTVLAAAFVLAWSSGFIGATLGTRSASAETLLMWRFLIAVPLLAVVSRGLRRPRLSRREIGGQALIGLLSQGVYLGGTVVAIGLGVNAGVAALIAALQPIAAAVFAGPVLGERVARRQWVGLAVGLLGVAVVVSGDLSTAHTAPAWAYLLPFAGMIGLVGATLLDRRLTPSGGLVQGLTVQCTVSAVVFTVSALASGHAAPPADATFWIAVAWVIGLSTAGGYGLYWLNGRRGSVTRVSSLIYLTPPTTLVWALLMFGDPIGPVTIAGVAVCLGGVLLVRHDAGERRPPASITAAEQGGAEGAQLAPGR